ncbi:hypothetical protein MMC16_005616, partial [Acarospora aff. strigata]|nr:hypothetical protein [Acarospora aff. strigata]
MRSAFITGALAIIATITPSLASPTPGETVRLWNGKRIVEAVTRVDPIDVRIWNGKATIEGVAEPKFGHGDRDMVSSNPAAVVKRELRYDCSRSVLCTSFVTAFQCFAAMTQIVDDTIYRTGA